VILTCGLTCRSQLSNAGLRGGTSEGSQSPGANLIKADAGGIPEAGKLIDANGKQAQLDE